MVVAQEFYNFASDLVHSGPDTFFARIGRTALVRTTIVPGAAHLLQQARRLWPWVPNPWPSQAAYRAGVQPLQGERCRCSLSSDVVLAKRCHPTAPEVEVPDGMPATAALG